MYDLSPESLRYVQNRPDWFLFSNVHQRLFMVGPYVYFLRRGHKERDGLFTKGFRRAYEVKPEKLLENDLFQTDTLILSTTFRETLQANATGIGKQMDDMLVAIHEFYQDDDEVDRLAVFLVYLLAAEYDVKIPYLDGIPTATINARRYSDDESQPPQVVRTFQVPASPVPTEPEYQYPNYEPSTLTGDAYDWNYCAMVAMQVPTTEQAKLVAFSYHPILHAIVELAENPHTLNMNLLGGREGRRTVLRKLIIETLGKINIGIEEFKQFVANPDERKNWKPYSTIVQFTMSQLIRPGKEEMSMEIYIRDLTNEVAYNTPADTIKQIGFVLTLAGIAVLSAGLGATVIATIFAGAGTAVGISELITQYQEDKHISSVNRAALVSQQLRVSAKTDNANLNLMFGIASMVISEVGGKLLAKIFTPRKAFDDPIETGNVQRLDEPRQPSPGDSALNKLDDDRKALADQRAVNEKQVEKTDALGDKSTASKISGYDNDVESDVDRAFDEMQIGGSSARPVNPRSTPPIVPQQAADAAAIIYENARADFNLRRRAYAIQLGLVENEGGQVHHSIELIVLKRYPGAFSAVELNAFSNMRGILPERTLNDLMDPRTGRKLFHNSKIREVWDNGYAGLDRKLKERLANPNSGFIMDLSPDSAYNQFIRKELTEIRDSIDNNYSMFFSENRSGFDWSQPRMLEADRQTIDKATRQKIGADPPPKAR